MTDYGHDIEKYLKGELTPVERHALEKKALNDPFLADALDGAEQIKSVNFFKDVAQLNERISGKKTVSVWMWTARIAAGLAFILVSTFIVWSVMETEPPQDLAMGKNERAEAPPATNDSVISATGTLSSPPIEQPIAEPASKDKKDAAKQPTSPLKTETKAVLEESEVKNEPIKETIAVTKTEEKADELKLTEPEAQTKSVEKETENYQAKAEDDRTIESKDTRRKASPNRNTVPIAADKSEVGLASSVTQRIVRGLVTSAEDGSVLPGVNVIIKGSTIGTVTNAQGNYEVTVPDTNPTLIYSFIGLQSTEVRAEDRGEVNVQMTSDITQLSEIVTTGYGVQSSKSVPSTVDLAHPETGNRAFKQYLEKNIRYPEQARINKIEGHVTIQFTVETDGTLTNFSVLRGIESSCDEELIRLLKEGPKWIPTKKDNVPVQDKAKVRLKFELPR